MTWTDKNATGLFPCLLLASLALHLAAAVALPLHVVSTCKTVKNSEPLMICFPVENFRGETIGKPKPPRSTGIEAFPQPKPAISPIPATLLEAPTPGAIIIPERAPLATQVPVSSAPREGSKANATHVSWPASGDTGRAGVLTGTGALVPIGNSGRGSTASSAGDALAGYRALLRRLIEEHKEYPLAARKAGIEGKCQVSFVLSRDGSVKQVKIVESCGHGFLDGAAARAVSAVGHFPPFPAGLGGDEETFNVSLSFRLKQR